MLQHTATHCNTLHHAGIVLYYYSVTKGCNGRPRRFVERRMCFVRLGFKRNLLVYIQVYHGRRSSWINNYDCHSVLVLITDPPCSALLTGSETNTTSKMQKLGMSLFTSSSVGDFDTHCNKDVSEPMTIDINNELSLDENHYISLSIVNSK